jgi:urease
MKLSPRELDKLVLAQTGWLAQKRLARGCKLNLTEATALIASQLQERIRDGNYSVSQLMQLGKEMLGRRHVLPSVPALLHDVQVEGTFVDGLVRTIAIEIPAMTLLVISKGIPGHRPRPYMHGIDEP